MRRAIVFHLPEDKYWGVLVIMDRQSSFKNFETEEEANQCAKDVNKWFDTLQGKVNNG